MSDRAQSRDARLSSLIAQYRERLRAGETISPEDFIANAPDLHHPFLELIKTSDLSGLIETSQPGTLEETIAASEQSAEKADTSAGIPKTFGRYDIKKLLGEGGMGAVYQAFDTQLHRLIALKVPKISGDAPESLARFYREARTAGAIRNANICPVYDVGEIDGQHYISMAFIEGKPLSAYINPRKPIPAKSIAVIVRKLSIALHEAHTLGVIHRDLKPDNIMIDTKHEPVIMDFGLARVESPLASSRMTQSGMILGTPAYMSPEQIEARTDNIGPASDQYSMGVVLYKMCTGQLPFRGSAASVFGQIMTKEPDAPSEIRAGVPPKLEAICLKMMSKNIEDRYTDMQEVAQVLAEFMKNPGPEQKVPQQDAEPTDVDNAQADEKTASNLEGAPDKTVAIATPLSTIETLVPSSKAPESTANRSPNPKKDVTSQGPPWWKNRLVHLGGIGGIVLLLGITFLVRLGKYDVQITLDDPSIALSVDGKPIKDTLLIKDGQSTIRLRAGEHKLVLEKEGLKTHVEEFTVTKDGKTALTVAIVNNKLDALLRGEKRPTTQARTGARADESAVAERGESALSMSEDNDVAVPTVDPAKRVGSAEPSAQPGPNNSLAFVDDETFVHCPGVMIDQRGPYTVEAWVRDENRRGNLLSMRNARPRLIGGGPNHGLAFEVAAFKSVGVSDKPIPQTGQWSHVAGVYAEGEARLYVDGTLIGSRAVPVDDEMGPVTDLSIGGRIQGSNSFGAFKGQIDEVRISNTSRYTSDFAPARRFELDEHTLALYHFDEGTGDVLRDSSGNGHDGTIVEAEWTVPSLSIAELLTSPEYEWTKPVRVPFPDGHQPDTSFGISGYGTWQNVYFSGQQSAENQNDIFVVERSLDGKTWGIPQALPEPINGKTFEGGASVTADGLVIVFDSIRSSNIGRRDLWIAERKTTQDPFGQLVHLGETINTDRDDSEPAISGDGLTLVWMSPFTPLGQKAQFGLRIASRKNRESPFGNVQWINFGKEQKTPGGAPWLAPDGNTLLFVEREDGGFRFCVSTRNAPMDPFGPFVRFGDDLSGFSRRLQPRLSPDRKWFYFSSNQGVSDDNVWMCQRVRKRSSAKNVLGESVE